MSRRRSLPVMCAALACAALTSSACGTRMGREDIALAARGGLAAPASAPGAATGLGFDAGGALGTDTGSLGAVGADGSSGTDTAGAGGRGAPAGGDADIGGAGTPAGGTSSGAATSRPGATGNAGGGGTGRTDTGPGAAAAAGQSPARPGQPAQSGTTNPVPGRPGTAPATGAKAPVAVGTVATLSGPVGEFTKSSAFAVSLWAKWINHRGGVNGHPVRHIVADDGGDPARYNASVRELAEKQGVVAFLFNTIGLAGGDLSYVNEKRIPIIGHEAGTELAYSSPMVFTPYASGNAYAYSLLAGVAQTVVPDGKRKLGSIACSDIKLCDLFDKTWNGPAAAELGFSPVYRARSSITQPDFTAECISARQAGAEVLIVGMDNNSALRLARSCDRQGYKPTIAIADQLALPAVAADPVMEGNLVATKVAPWPDTSVPGTAEMHRAFAELAPGVTVNGAHAGAWVAARTFELAARNLPATPAPADVLAGLWAINGDNIGGMTYPLTFPKDQPSPRRMCWGTTLIRGGKFVTPPNGQLRCKA